MRKAIAVIIAFAGALALAAAAAGSSTSDPQGDTQAPSAYDIAAAASGHVQGKPNRLYQRIRVYGDITPGCGNACAEYGVLFYDHRPATHPAYKLRYLGDGNQVQVRAVRPNGSLGATTGTARVVQPSPSVVTFRFNRHAIGNPPHRYFWKAYVSFEDVQAPCDAGCTDRAPDSGVVRQNLPLP